LSIIPDLAAAVNILTANIVIDDFNFCGQKTGLMQPPLAGAIDSTWVVTTTRATSTS
jgi:hypothetical protein